MHDVVPNPSHQHYEGTVDLDVHRRERIEVRLLDVAGRQIMLLLDAVLDPGSHRIRIVGARLVPGIYYVVATTAGGELQSETMVVR